MANVFPMIGMMIINILKNIPVIGPIFGHWIAVITEGSSIMSITKAVTLLGLSIGLIGGGGLLVLTMGGIWEAIVLFIMKVLIPIFSKLPEGDEKFNAWESSWFRFFSIIQKILMGVGTIFFIAGILAVILYLIIALPELLMKLIMFILNSIMKIIMDEKYPIFAPIRMIFNAAEIFTKPPEEVAEDVVAEAENVGNEIASIFKPKEGFTNWV